MTQVLAVIERLSRRRMGGGRIVGNTLRRSRPCGLHRRSRDSGRQRAVAALLAALALAAVRPLRSSWSQPVSNAPTVISLGPSYISVAEGAPATAELRLTDGPASGGFDVVITYLPGVVVPTAVRFGATDAASGATVSGSPMAAGSGKLRLRGAFGGGSTPSSPVGMGLLIATVSFAPVAVGSSSIAIEEARITGADSAVINAVTSGSAMATVVAPPTASGVEAALHQSTSLTQTVGLGVPAIGGLVGSLTSTLRLQGWTLLWLGLLLTGAAVVGVGWLLGRPRSAPSGAPARVYWTRDEDGSAAESPVIRPPRR